MRLLLALGVGVGECGLSLFCVPVAASNKGWGRGVWTKFVGLAGGGMGGWGGGLGLLSVQVDAVIAYFYSLHSDLKTRFSFD